MKSASLLMGLVMSLVLTACGEVESDREARGPTRRPRASPSAKETAKYVGFHPESRQENGMVVMPLVFVDGSSAEAVAPDDLGIQGMSVAIYTSGGVGGVDRTIDFSFGNGSWLMHEGPLRTYEGVDGSKVELWKPSPDTPAGCPNLVYRFDEWFVGVRTCQDELSESERQSWARLLRGEVTDGGFLVLSATGPLVLTQAGGHEGPAIILGMDRANWIQLQPGKCEPQTYVSDGDIEIMPDGTRVSFNRLEDGNSKIDYDWFVSWCEDEQMRVQVEYAYEDFAKAAAESFRLRDIVLAQ